MEFKAKSNLTNWTNLNNIASQYKTRNSNFTMNLHERNFNSKLQVAIFLINSISQMKLHNRIIANILD